MALMLNILERQSNRIYEGKEPDYELLHDIMHYMTVYPDTVHHPKEDCIYAELKAARPDLATGFERITMDHRHIAELSIKLRDDVAALAVKGAEAILRREVNVSVHAELLQRLKTDARLGVLQGLQDYSRSLRGAAADTAFAIESGYTPSIIARSVEMLHLHMHRHFGFGARFESRIEAEMAQLVFAAPALTQRQIRRIIYG